jgi:hypothetical protein
MTELSTVITEGLNIISQYALPLLMALAAVGVLTMAVQQVVKDMGHLHARFTKRELERWMRGRGSADARDQLVLLTTGGDEVALCELSIAGVMGQIAMASRVAIAYPIPFEALMRALAGPHAHGDIETVLGVARAEERIAEMKRTGTFRPEDSAGDAQPAQRQQAQLDVEQARTRISHLMERNIDALQITLSSRWERRNKMAAFALSWVLTVVAFFLYFYVNSTTLNQSAPALARFAFTTVAAGLLAGFLAPVAKDLVTALQRLKGGR